MRGLTARQKQILEFLVSYTRKHGYPPTVREIGVHFGFLWSAAREHLRLLEKKGAIRINRARSRGIELEGLNREEGMLLPVAGRIRAGEPLLAIQDAGVHILVDKSLFPSENSFALRVTGDSMIEAGILDGDYVIAKQQSTIEHGEIGVVIIGDEATVKRVLKSEGSITLKPENRYMEPVHYSPDEVSIIGKVIGVIRKL